MMLLRARGSLALFSVVPSFRGPLRYIQLVAARAQTPAGQHLGAIGRRSYELDARAALGFRLTAEDGGRGDEVVGRRSSPPVTRISIGQIATCYDRDRRVAMRPWSSAVRAVAAALSTYVRVAKCEADRELIWGALRVCLALILSAVSCVYRWRARRGSRRLDCLETQMSVSPTRSNWRAIWLRDKSSRREGQPRRTRRYRTEHVSARSLAQALAPTRH
jgi:hypothetical protein